MIPELVTVETEVKMATSLEAAKRVARKTAEKQNPGFIASDVRKTSRRGRHGGFMFEVDLDEKLDKKHLDGLPRSPGRGLGRG